MLKVATLTTALDSRTKSWQIASSTPASPNIKPPPCIQTTTSFNDAVRGASILVYIFTEMGAKGALSTCELHLVKVIT